MFSDKSILPLTLIFENVGGNVLMLLRFNNKLPFNMSLSKLSGKVLIWLLVKFKLPPTFIVHIFLGILQSKLSEIFNYPYILTLNSATSGLTF